MGYDYDSLYGERRNALGQPIPFLVEFFRQLDMDNARVLDIGCGQGRDALFIARLGHRVVGVDQSPNGIHDLTTNAQAEALNVQGLVADIIEFTPDGLFDIVLIDRTLHMLNDTPRLKVLNKLLGHVTEGGWVLIADEASNIEGFKTTISNHTENWTSEVCKRGYLFIRRM